MAGQSSIFALVERRFAADWALLRPILIGHCEHFAHLRVAKLALRQAKRKNI
jgi:hypothetical protein